MYAKPLLVDAKNIASKNINDFKYSLEWSRYFLFPIGIWATERNRSLVKQICNIIVISVCYFLLAFLMIVVGLYAIIENPQTRMKLIGPLSFCVMAILKYNSLVSRQNDIKNCVFHVREDWTSLIYDEDRAIMLKGAKAGRFLGVLSAIFMYSGGFFFHGVLPLSAIFLNINGNQSAKPLTYPVYSGFFDVTVSPTYEIIFLVQSIIGYLEYNITIALCSLAAVFVLHTSAQLRLVMTQLTYLVDGRKCEKNSAQERLVLIVRRHRNALSFVRKVENILNLACLVECVGCTFNICFIGYYILQGLEKRNLIVLITFLILFVSVSFNIFILCYIGEILTEQCKMVGKICYDIEWYRLTDRHALDMIFILQMSQHPAKITAGKLIDLSLASFTSVVKSAMAYLNVLRAMTT